MSVFCWFNNYSIVVCFEVRYYDASGLIFLVQDCFGYSGTFVILNDFQDCLFYFCKECNWSFDRKEGAFSMMNSGGHYIAYSNHQTWHYQMWAKLTLWASWCVMCVVFLPYFFWSESNHLTKLHCLTFLRHLVYILLKVNFMKDKNILKDLI